MVDLEQILANRRWMRVSRPFPHVTACNVFQPEFYSSLDQSFRRLLALGLADSPTPRQFSRIFQGYDAYGLRIPSDPANPLSVFVSRQWHDMVSALLGLDATGDVSAELHHHKTGSANGQVHNDFNPGWFLNEAGPEAVNLADPEICQYKTGRCRSEGRTARETIRAATVLFYLGNPVWRTGEGGETGLYESHTDAPDTPASTIPPENNSLLVFECTPFSFHSFLSNHRNPRNSVILWLHRTPADAASRWGRDKIRAWS